VRVAIVPQATGETMIDRHHGRRLTMLITLGLTLTGCAVSAMAQQPTRSLMASANVALPPGPFAEWPDADRVTATHGVQLRCMMLSGMAFANYQGPKEAGREAGTAVALLCTANNMPSDWPDADATRQAATAHYETAKKLDPKISDPALIAGGMGHHS
jgi:hypothetical protein